VNLDRARVFRLLETADNFVKYATPGHEGRAADRARARYESALELAQNNGDAALVEQVRLRIDDLGRRAALADAESSAPAAADTGNEGVPQAREVRALSATGADPASSADRRVPPGQRVTRGWPVLHEGPIPRFDRDSWRLQIHGACKRPYGLGYDELHALPQIDLRSDFHCVTGWSKLDNLWRGVQTRILLDKAAPAQDASHVLVHGEHGYTANVPVEVLMEEASLVTWSHDSEELEPRHGFPLRLLLPRLYGWKSVKWVRSFELLTHDQRGFWETRGYHNHADPWREERYAYQEG
jgi:DMSO/TMAO reductase YedYZ molybdopterin-dependent catalytic subunit